MHSNLRIHIAPIGFEVKRVTDPIVSERADKVYLITQLKNDKATEHINEIKNVLKNEKSLEIVTMGTNIWDLYECIKTYKQIIEKEKNSHIYINVSTGSKISCIAGMLACMIWRGTPYYAMINYDYISNGKDKFSKENLTGLIELPVYSINKPRKEWLIILEILRNNKGKINKHKLIEKLEDSTIINQQLSIAAKHSRLKSLLTPISIYSDNPLVQVEYKGRQSNIILTQQGENTLKIFS